MLRLTVTTVLLGLSVGASALASPAAPDTVLAPETRDLLDLGLSGSEAWYVRGFDSLFARDATGAGEAARTTNERIDAAFLPYAGLRIRHVWILGREAFGTLVADTAASVVEDPTDTLETQVSAFARSLNAVTTETRDFVIRNYLRFDEGDVIDPYALADSERLLRGLAYTSDAKIEVVPLVLTPGWADVVVLVRDRWPLGAKAKIHTAERYDIAVYHRNVAGLGLDLELELPYERGRSPETGWRARASLGNLGGSFIDLDLRAQHQWSRDQRSVALERDFVHPDIRAVGGLGLLTDVAKDHPELPEGVELETRVRDFWFGWSIRLRDGGADGRRRVRLVPAVRAEVNDFRDPPLAFATGERQWRDYTRYFGQFSLVGVDYYTANLVYGYGETEDLPSGTWAALVGGFETGEVSDRLYHGLRLLLPRYAASDHYVALGLGLGGFRHRGRMEDGVLDLFIGGFAPLRRHGYGNWRHFYGINYTLGINRRGTGGLRLDAFSLRDLDSDAVAGNQRLAVEAESVLFTRYALLGFKAAAFGYVAGGFVGDESDLVTSNRFAADVAVGLRLNNPRLVFPTIEMRAGILSTSEGVEPVLSVSMGDVGFLRRGIPSVKPGIVPFI